MELIDLTRLLDANEIERLPDDAKLGASVLVPNVEHITPSGSGADIMCMLFGCSRDDLPEGEGRGDESIHISTHLGTHVEAGFLIERLVEPAPEPQMATSHPENFQKLSTEPGFIFFRLVTRVPARASSR